MNVRACTTLGIMVALLNGRARADGTGQPPAVVSEMVATNQPAPATVAQRNVAPADAPAADERDPFWPIGYTPAPPVASNEVRVVAPATPQVRQIPTEWPELKVTGLTRTPEGSYLAFVIGSGFVEPGDIVTIKRNGMVYRWKVNAVSEKGLATSRLDARPQ